MYFLLTLNASRAMVLHRLPETCNAITTPLVHRNWAAALQEHPDREYVSYILEGISQGFKLGVDYANNSFKSAKANMRSSLTNPGPVIEVKELEANSTIIISFWGQTLFAYCGRVRRKTGAGAEGRKARADQDEEGQRGQSLANDTRAAA